MPWDVDIGRLEPIACTYPTEICGPADRLTDISRPQTVLETGESLPPVM
jgi:hypothetical protein